MLVKRKYKKNILIKEINIKNINNISIRKGSYW
jgi:hypothetical protein